MDRSNGNLLQSYKDADYTNSTYRIRSTLIGNDGVVLSGSEDGYIYAWDVLTGKRLERASHYRQEELEGTRSSRKVVSAVAQKKRADEWASASGDGKP